VTSSLDTQRKVGGATWLFGMLWFFDDYSNTAIVGTTMREISDEVQISREARVHDRLDGRSRRDVRHLEFGSRTN